MAFTPIKITNLRALHDNVLVEDMNFTGRTLTSGIILPSDNGKSSGIRPRWARVRAIGAEHTVVKTGQWVCVAHGRWTRGIEIEDTDGTVKTIRRVDPNDILLVSDQQPDDDTMSDAVVVPERSR